MKALTLILTTLSLTLIFSNCGKPKTPEPETPQPITEVKIGTQSLTDTKTTFRGKWKLHYTFGGFSGLQRVDFTNTTFNFTVTDSIYRYDNNIQTINSPITFQYSPVFIDTYSTYILDITNPQNVMDNSLIAFSKKGDTLILSEPHTNPDKYFLTKQ